MFFSAQACLSHNTFEGDKIPIAFKAYCLRTGVEKTYHGGVNVGVLDVRGILIFSLGQ